MENQITEYIVKALQSGQSLEKIEQDLVAAGMNQEQIDQFLHSFKHAAQAETPDDILKQMPPLPQETIKTKIVALWLVLQGLALALAGIGILVAMWVVFGLSSATFLTPYPAYMPIVKTSATIVSLLALVNAYFFFKISNGLHKLQAEAYKAAHLLLAISCLLSALAIVIPSSWPLSSKGLSTFLSLSLNLIMLLLLRSEKANYRNITKVKIYHKAAAAMAITLICMIGTLAILHAGNKKAEQEGEKTYGELLQKYEDLQQSIKTEVGFDTQAWTEYINPEYGFSIQVPEEWNSQEFNPYTDGSWIVAFSEFGIPSRSNQGSWEFYVRIFPTANYYNYRLYQENLETIGSNVSLNEAYTLDNEPGVLISTQTIAAEHQGYVYELHLESQLKGDQQYELNEWSQNIADSFRFL